jgi:uncharacterized damage-inducible protein DinB
MNGRPGSSEAAPYYFNYIDRIPGDDIAGVLRDQLEESLAFWTGIGEERSLHRYAPEKWSIRQVLNHVNDAERVFESRALWFARGFDSALPSFDQDVSNEAARSDDRSWASHCEEFRAVRQATLALVRNLPADAWMRSGVASGYSFTVRALAYIVAGHCAHHMAIVRERYL